VTRPTVRRSLTGSRTGSRRMRDSR
jgi:hypothetical protein